MSYRSDQYEYMSLDDFEELLADKPRDEKWELIGGRVVKMMVGARWGHHLIVQNLAFGLRQRLRAGGRDCQVTSETFYMKNLSVESATLPDVVVRCGPTSLSQTSFDDPLVLVEVVSPGSEGRDRWEKWAIYRKLASLQHYVLIERDRPVIDVFDRTGDAWASRRTLEGLSEALDLPAIGVRVPLAEIYQDVLTA